MNPISKYLMSCYLYYEKDESVISDEEFDALCKYILDNWSKIEHPHKHLVCKGALEAGTGYDIKYTNMIVGAAHHWLDRSKDG